MFIEKQREAELARRKGTTQRVIIQVVWLLIWLAVAYFATNYLFETEELTAGMFYNVGVPTEVPEPVIFWTIVLFIIFVSQIFLTMGFILGSSRGRRKPGQPSAYSDNPDPLDRQFN